MSQYGLPYWPGISTSVTAPSQVNIVRRFSSTMTTAMTANIRISQGWASGHIGPFIWKWYKAAMSRLPRAALNIGVRMIVIARTPMKYGPNDQALCGLPLRKNAGRCQRPQIPPRIRLDQMGAKRRCRRGSATPRQPNSSIGPITSPVANAGSTLYQGEKGNGSVIMPLMAAPK